MTSAALLHGLRDGLEVIWIHAATMEAFGATRARQVARVAKVIEGKAIWDGADPALVRIAMSVDLSAGTTVGPKLAVAGVREDLSFPQPALLGRSDRHPSSEAFLVICQSLCHPAILAERSTTYKYKYQE